MAEAAVIVNVFGQLRQWLFDWLNLKRQRTEREDQASKTQTEGERQAIQALLMAVTQTQVYLGTQAAGGKSDRDVEGRLAMAWATAAGAFASVNQYVAPLLQLKSEAWARPDLWSNERCIEAGITIEDIAELARQYLAGIGPAHLSA
jgi:hypothetical protein